MNMIVPEPLARPNARSSGHSRWRLVATIFASATGLTSAYQGVASIALPRSLQQFDPVHKVSLLATTTTLAAILAIFGMVLGGMISDRTHSRWGRRTPSIAIGCTVAAILLVMMGSARSAGALMILMPALWLALNFYQAAMTAMLTDRVAPGDLGKVSAAIALGAPVGTLIGVNITSFVTSALGSYMAIAAVLLAGTGILIGFTPESPYLERKVQARPKQGWALSSFGDRDFSLAFVSRFLLFIAFYSVTGYLFFLVQDYIGLQRLPGRDAGKAVSVVFSIITVGWIVVTPITGFIADRIAKIQWIVGLSSIGIGLSIMVPALYPTWTAMIVFSAGVGVSFGIYVAIDLKLMALVLPDPDAAGRDMALLGVAGGAPQILTPSIAAAIIGMGGYSSLFLPGAVVGIIGGIASFFIQLKRHRERADGMASNG